MFLEVGSHSLFFQGRGGLAIDLFFRRGWGGGGSNCMDSRLTFFLVMDIHKSYSE